MQSKQPLALPTRYGDIADPRHPETGKPICASQSRRPNKYGDYVCIGKPMIGSKRCRMHGGKTPTGIASPHYKTGQHVRHGNRLPAKFLDEFYAALASDDADQLLDLSAEIALLDVRVGELLAQLDTGESSRAWANAATQFEAMKTAMAKDDVRAATDAMNRLETILTEADRAYDAKWAVIQEVIQQRVRVVDTERRRRIDKQETMTVKEATWLFRAIMSIIKARVHDRDVLAAITTDINGLVAARMGGSASSR